MNKNFEEALQFRHSCKTFDVNKTISKKDMNFIINAGRVSPSSYGLEPVEYLVIKNQQLKEKIQSASMNQMQVSQCSHLMIVLVGINETKINSGIPKKRFERLGMPKENLEFFLSLYEGFTKMHLNSDEQIYHWASKQAYIAVANMMTAAAIQGVDSCPLEGFEKDKVEKILDINPLEHQVALVLPFGYREKQQSKQIRRDFDDIVTFIE